MQWWHVPQSHHGCTQQRVWEVHQQIGQVGRVDKCCSTAYRAPPPSPSTSCLARKQSSNATGTAVASSELRTSSLPVSLLLLLLRLVGESPSHPARSYAARFPTVPPWLALQGGMDTSSGQRGRALFILAHRLQSSLSSLANWVTTTSA